MGEKTDSETRFFFFFGIPLLFIAHMWKIMQLDDLLEWLRGFFGLRASGEGSRELTGGPGGPGGPLGPSSPWGPCGGKKQG